MNGDTLRVVHDDGVRDMRAVWSDGDEVWMIDQRPLPQRLEVVRIHDHLEMAVAIRDMYVRGAPSIGAAAAYGMALAAMGGGDLDGAARALKATRPTAFDLFFAVDLMLKSLASGESPMRAADAYADAVVDRCAAIGKAGASLMPDGGKVMTHCNAGALATVDVGTALAPIRAARDEGKELFVYVSETRPRMQGMRLTAWELQNEGIPYAIISDGASGHFIREDVDAIIVGADRIAANGDFANKIGTFEKAVLAERFDVPFYVAAPVSTFDPSVPSGDGIEIEYRSQDEVTDVRGVRIAPEGAKALNPAFDVTPAELVTAFITEVGVLTPSEIGRLANDARE